MTTVLHPRTAPIPFDTDDDGPPPYVEAALESLSRPPEAGACFLSVRPSDGAVVRVRRFVSSPGDEVEVTYLEGTDIRMRERHRAVVRPCSHDAPCGLPGSRILVAATPGVTLRVDMGLDLSDYGAVVALQGLDLVVVLYSLATIASHQRALVAARVRGTRCARCIGGA